MTKKSELSYEELKRRLEAAETTIQALQASETRLRLIFENAFDGISIHEEIPEKRSRRLIDCNTRYAEMAGRPKKELLRLENTGKLQRKLDRSRSTEENRRLREEKTPYRGIFSWIRPDREENVIEYTAVPIEAKDRPLTIGIDRDITEKVNAKKEREDAVRALEESQRQLSSLLSNLPGMAYRCLNEPGWPMSFVSEGCRELTGYAPTEMTNSEYPQYGDLIHPADKQRVWDTIQEAVDADAHFTLEYRIRIKGSEERWVWERGHVVPKQGSESTHLEGFISDITERKLAEEDLRLFKAIVENSSEAIAISDPEGILVYINEAHEKLFGRSLEEATQANYRDFYPPDSVEILNQEVAPALARGDSWEGELDVYDAAGRRFPL
jgi:PAS domain S-box-containing protein